MTQAYGDVDDDAARAIAGVASVNASIPTAELQTIFQIEPEQIALSRDVLETANGGAVNFDPSFADADSYGVETDPAQGNSRSALETAKQIDYRSGHTVGLGVGLRLATRPEVGVAQWGLGAEGRTNRAFYEDDADGSFGAVVERAGVRTKVSASEWSNLRLRDVQNENGNVDFQAFGYNPLGNGILADPIDPSRGYIWGIDWGWYGYSAIVFYIVAMMPMGYQYPVPCVALIPTGSTSLVNVNHPLFIRADNEGSTTSNATEVAVSGRQASFWGSRLGRLTPIRHVDTSPPAISDSSYTTLLIFRRKTGFQGAPLDVVDVNINGGNVYDVEVRGRVDVTSPTPVDPNRDSEDTPPIDVDEGTSVDSSGGELTGYPTGGGFVRGDSPGGQGGVGTLEAKRATFVRSEWAAIVAKDVSGAGSSPNAVAYEFASGVN